MELTRFERLRRVVESLGASQVVASLEKRLLGEGIDVEDSERVITGDNGVYYITPDGALVRVLIYIVDKSISDRYGKKIASLVNSREFGAQELIRNLHRYHLVKCKTIERAESEGWKTKYKISRRQNGHFFYRFIDGSRVLPNGDQILLPCKNCLTEINHIFRKRYTVDSFDPEALLTSEEFTTYGFPKAGNLADFSNPNIYSKDWAEISRKYRNLVKFQCQEPACPAPDLSDNRYMQYLHVHHVSLDKSNNAYHNLKALCIYCHAAQPNHASMRQMPMYKEYVQLRGLGQTGGVSYG